MGELSATPALPSQLPSPGDPEQVTSPSESQYLHLSGMRSYFLKPKNHEFMMHNFFLTQATGNLKCYETIYSVFSLLGFFCLS